MHVNGRHNELTHTFTSVLLNAWKVLAVSVLGLSSVFFTSVSFTTGAADADAGDGFCGGFWALWTKTNKQTNNLLLKNNPSLLNPNTKLILEDNLFSSPYASFAWYIGRSTTQAVGHWLLCRSPGACGSPGGTGYGIPGTRPTGSPWSRSFVLRNKNTAGK